MREWGRNLKYLKAEFLAKRTPAVLEDHSLYILG